MRLMDGSYKAPRLILRRNRMQYRIDELSMIPTLKSAMSLCSSKCKKRKVLFLYAPVLFSLLALSAVVSAHSVGTSLEKVVGEYVIDIGYSAPSIMAREPMHFDFTIFSGTASPQHTEVDFSDTWVRVEQGEATLFAAGIARPEFGLAGMTFTFPASGEYLLSIRFQKEGEVLAEAAFPLSVIPETEGASGARLPYTAMIIALCLGIGAGVLGVWSYMHRKNS